PKTDYTVGAGATSIEAALVNGDTHLDLITADMTDGTVSVLLGTGDGPLQPRKILPLAPGVNATASGFFNADTNLDLAVTNFDTDSVSIYFGAGDGTFTFSASYSTGDGPLYVAAGDFDGVAGPDL